MTTGLILLSMLVLMLPVYFTRYFAQPEPESDEPQNNSHERIDPIRDCRRDIAIEFVDVCARYPDTVFN